LADALQNGPPILGVLRHNDSVHIPSRHLGLIQAEENQDLEQVIETIASGVTRETILDKLFQIGSEITNQAGEAAKCLAPLGQNIAIARDRAFSFAYPHLLQTWKNQGANLSFFQPLNNEAPDSKADAIYLPGGYPELHAGVLAANSVFLKGLRNSSALIYGECGGYMALGEAIIDKDGTSHAMAGLLPVVTSFATRKLFLGYRQLTTLNGPFAKNLRGHEFHYSTHAETASAEPLFAATTANGDALPNMGQRVGKVMGSYAHIISEAPQ
jgi:cobyrinic acid a,c-diamide synthase